MSVKIKGIKIKGYQNETITVCGILTEDQNKCIACGLTVRADNQISVFGGKNGDTAIMADAYIQIFGVKSVGEVDSEGFATADLWPITEESTSVAFMKFHKEGDMDAQGNKVWGDLYAGTIFDGDVYKGNSDKPAMNLRDLFAKDIMEAIDNAPDQLRDVKIVTSRNARLAGIASMLTNKVIPNKKAEPAATATHAADNKGAMPTGGTSAAAALGN